MKDWSTIPKQAFLVEDGKVGDCWRCCIAAILNLPAAEVPHFLESVIADNRSLDPVTQEWLNGRGWCLVYTSDTLQCPRYYNEKDGVVWPAVISCGPSPRSKKMGEHHAVVTVNGKVVYDPHPSNAGLTAVTHIYVLVPLRRDE